MFPSRLSSPGRLGRTALAMAAAIVMELHGDLLRGLCDALGVHCQGLSQAAGRARAGALLDNGLCNKLVAVDTCFGLLRHVTKVSADRLRGDVFAAIVPAAQTHLHQPDVVMDESVCELRAEAPEFVPAVIFEAPPWDKPTTSTASGGGHRNTAVVFVCVVLPYDLWFAW